MNKIDRPQGETFYQINPLSKRSCSFIFHSFNSNGIILYVAQDIGAVPGSTSIENSTSWPGGMLGSSFENTFEEFFQNRHLVEVLPLLS